MAGKPVAKILRLIALKEAIGKIQGKEVQSINEWYAYRAVSRLLSFPISFHYPIDGGAELGGQILDIVVWSPKPKAIYVGKGGYYHGQSKDAADMLKHERARQLGFEVYDLTEFETETQEGADAAVMDKIR